jgi:N-methylhydantoinase B
MHELAADVDVITSEIVRTGMTAAALEMSRTFVRTAYNPLLYESEDFGLGIVSPEAQLWGEAPGIALFVGCLPGTIRTGLEKWGLAGFVEGDLLIANDPYLTGTHISDTSIYLPIFHEGELVAFSVATAHWADVGGKSPGGWCPDSTDVYQEGICFGHEKLEAAGARNRALWDVLIGNVRYPETVRGDLEAQIAACRQGAARVRALCERYGTCGVRDGMAHAIAMTDRAVRAQIAEVPDGTYRAAVNMDGDGVTDDPFPLAVTLQVRGDTIRVSFEGTSAARRGPVNMPAIGTMAAVKAAIKGLTLPTDPTNEGHAMALEFDLEPGSALTPQRPTPVDSYGYLAGALGELTVRALAQAVPDRCPAGGHMLLCLFLFRVDPRDGRPFILIDPTDAGGGGRPFEDAPTLNCLTNGDVPNTPVEVIESRYPVRCERFEHLPEVAGAGTYRGGMGVRRDYRMLEGGVQMQLLLENTRDILGRGVGGGFDGAPARVVVRPGSLDEDVVQEKVSFYGPLGAGDVVSARSAGGGGWGSPVAREPAAVADDVRDELICRAEAEAVYGVVVTQDGGGAWQVDEAATRRLRASPPSGGAPAAAAASSQSP